MGPIADPSRYENKLQKVMRVMGCGAFFALLASGPFLQVVAGPARTHASVPFPTWDTTAFRDGAWMTSLERHAQELSPVTFNLRGFYNETLYRFGLLDPTYIHLGSDRWMFMSETLRADPARLASAAERRRRTLESIRRRCEELGVKLLAMPVPDKVRIYPEHAYSDGRMPASKETLYGTIVREMEDAGIQVLNVEGILQEEKRAPTGGPLFYERDSHWTGHAALVVGAALGVHLQELGWDHLLGEPVELVPGAAPIEVVPDLVGSLGFRALAGVFEGSSGLMLGPHDERPQRISSLVRSLSEEKDYFRVWIAGEDGGPNIVFEDSQHLGKLALCGTSFSEECLRWAVPYVLGRRVDARGVVVAGGPFRGLRGQLERIERGESDAVIVVWEMVERMYLEEEWMAPPVF